jgi:hypothetical protein
MAAWIVGMASAAAHSYVMASESARPASPILFASAAWERTQAALPGSSVVSVDTGYVILPRDKSILEPLSVSGK